MFYTGSLVKQIPTFDELLQCVIRKTEAETHSKRGNVYEKVCDIIIKFGFCPILSNNIYNHYEGNINTCKLKKVEDLEIYFQNFKHSIQNITIDEVNSKFWNFKYFM